MQRSVGTNSIHWCFLQEIFENFVAKRFQVTEILHEVARARVSSQQELQIANSGSMWVPTHNHALIVLNYDFYKGTNVQLRAAL